MQRIVNRQTMNIGIDLSVAGNNNFNINMNLRFVPDEVIVRSLIYTNTGAADTTIVGCQVWTNLIDDNILCMFGSGSNQITQLENHFTMTRKFQAGSVNFQVQVMPTLALGYTGNGNLVTGAVQGNLFFLLEFVKYEN